MWINRNQSQSLITGSFFPLSGWNALQVTGQIGWASDSRVPAVEIAVAILPWSAAQLSTVRVRFKRSNCQLEASNIPYVSISVCVFFSLWYCDGGSGCRAARKLFVSHRFTCPGGYQTTCGVLFVQKPSAPPSVSKKWHNLTQTACICAENLSWTISHRLIIISHLLWHRKVYPILQLQATRMHQVSWLRRSTMAAWCHMDVWPGLSTKISQQWMRTRISMEFRFEKDSLAGCWNCWSLRTSSRKLQDGISTSDMVTNWAIWYPLESMAISFPNGQIAIVECLPASRFYMVLFVLSDIDMFNSSLVISLSPYLSVTLVPR